MKRKLSLMTKEQWRKRQEQWEKFNAWERTQPKQRPALTLKEARLFAKKIQRQTEESEDRS